MAIPYCDGGFRITAVKFRFVDDEPNGFRYTMAQGSKPGLYGLWQPLKPLLILTEGEINALSVWQTLGGGATVLSCGGQTNHLDLAKRLLVEARKQGIRTFVWFDDLAIAKTFQPVADKVITSPLIGKTKYDANAMLQDGVLDEFLKRLMEAEHA